MIHFDDLGFDAEYEIDGSPEYPGDGKWSYPEHRIESSGTLQRGGPVAVVHPAVGEPWVLSAGLDYVADICGSPDPNLFCLVERFERAILVDARDPTTRVVLEVRPVRVAANLKNGLLLFTDWSSLTAFGVEGKRWESGSLFGEDLRILSSRGDRIVCEGTDDYYDAVRRQVTLDARTGEVIPTS